MVMVCKICKKNIIYVKQKCSRCYYKERSSKLNECKLCNKKYKSDNKKMCPQCYDLKRIRIQKCSVCKVKKKMHLVSKDVCRLCYFREWKTREKKDGFCIVCDKKLDGSRRKFCNARCNRTYWQENNENKFKASQKKAMNKFRTEKREYFNELMRKSYKRNRNKNLERKVTHYLRKEIIKIIGNKCKCGKKYKQIHHKKYLGISLVSEMRAILKEYCKNLEPLCKDCHWKKHGRK